MRAARRGHLQPSIPPGAAGGSGAASINSSGQVAGDFSDANFVGHSYLRASDGSFTTFDVPGACYAVALGLNNSGTIVGQYATLTTGGNCYANPVHLFLRAADGTFTTFDVPGRVVSTCRLSLAARFLAINSSGAVLGTFFDANGVAHGFLRPGTDPSGHTAGSYTRNLDRFQRTKIGKIETQPGTRSPTRGVDIQLKSF